MKKLSLLLTAAIFVSVAACKKTADVPEVPSNAPRSEVPAELRGNWMYGYFSLTEYWNEDPSGYLGNGFEFAIAFDFEGDGDYVQYFTSKTYAAGVAAYHQSVTRGTVVFDAANHSFKTYPYAAHYKRTANGHVAEDRDLAKTELTGVTSYSYSTGNESNGARAIYLKLDGTANALTFLKK